MTANLESPINGKMPVASLEAQNPSQGHSPMASDSQKPAAGIISHNGNLPSSVTDAVLVPSNEMPINSQKVEELDFNAFAGRPITVDDLMSGMNNMGFQASSIGEAVRIINDMVSVSIRLLCFHQRRLLV